MRKGIIAPIILVVVFLVGIGVAAVYFQSKSKSAITPSPSPILSQSTSVSPTPAPMQAASVDDKANWETYTLNNASFSYPSTWHQSRLFGEGTEFGGGAGMRFSNYPFTEQDSVSWSSPYSSNDDYVTLDFNFSYQPEDKNRTFNDFIKKIKEEYKANSEEQVKSKTGVQFVIFQYASTSMNSVRASTIDADKTYTFTMEARSNDVLEKYKSVLKDIISTFRYTN